MPIRMLVVLLAAVAALPVAAQPSVEKWKPVELSFKGPATGNPFIDISLSADFTQGSSTITVDGFYDGGGIYRLRFMPQAEGQWTYVTHSNSKALDGKKGRLTCTPAVGGNHGPVMVKDTFGFAYADGRPYHPFGTTCYAWAHQGDSLEAVTLQTLSGGWFNKMRMCIFPKDYSWNRNEPPLYPFEGKPLKDWDYTRFNPAYFRHFERRIAQLDSMGIEADLIVFHPYDRWGFSKMDSAADDRYIRYIVARFAAYKNVWWSMANEYDFMKAKKRSDWDRFIALFAQKDPYHHLRGIHNGYVMYDHHNPLITHVSIQNEETWKAIDLRAEYHKPVVYDECRYEGNIPRQWGDLTAQEMTNKVWRGTVAGGYVGHGETLMTDDTTETATLWWSKGGTLKGESYKRIKFLKEILEAAPVPLRPRPRGILTHGDDYYLIYLNLDQPIMWPVSLPASRRYKVELIDSWGMTITPLPGYYSGNSLIKLPGRPGTALRITVAE